MIVCLPSKARAADRQASLKRLGAVLRKVGVFFFFLVVVFGSFSTFPTGRLYVMVLKEHLVYCY